MIAEEIFEGPGSRPQEWPWWRTTPRSAAILFWIVLIHITAAAGLILFPLPGWGILFGALGLAWLGGLGTTVCYHRAIAHRALKLNPWVSAVLTFFAVFNGSGVPISWVAGHRSHHAYADTAEDISSPLWHGFWWAHLRWLWQADPPSVARFCPDLAHPSFQIWRYLQAPILTISYLGGLSFGLRGFFWLGAIRLVFVLHAQCFVNSICHSASEAAPGEDSSSNVFWLGFVQLLHGENWHRNHHTRPGLAQLGWKWWQLDGGYLVIRMLEKLGAATEVRRLHAR